MKERKRIIDSRLLFRVMNEHSPNGNKQDIEIRGSSFRFFRSTVSEPLVLPNMVRSPISCSHSFGNGSSPPASLADPAETNFEGFPLPPRCNEASWTNLPSRQVFNLNIQTSYHLRSAPRSPSLLLRKAEGFPTFK